MTAASSFPVSGWADQWASYDMKVIGAVVAFIRDHGPVADERALAVIRRAGIGSDVRKASPAFDERDGERRILNFLVADIDVVERTADGLLYVAPDVVEVISARGGPRFVPSAADRAADAAQAKHIEHLRRWVFRSPFAVDWRDGIRRWNDEAIFAMAQRIKAVGYCGSPIVCDQNGVIINGHLRYAALTLLDRDPAAYIETRVFDNDLHRLAYVIAVHQHGTFHHRDGGFPVDLKNAIVAYVNSAAARSGEKVTWPDDISAIVGTDHRMPALLAKPEMVEVEPTVTTTPIVTAVAANPVDPTKPLAPSKRRVLRLLANHGPATADELAEVSGGKPRDHLSPRLAELRKAGHAEVVGRNGNQTWSATPQGLAMLDAVYRPPLGTPDVPGRAFNSGNPLVVGQILVNASEYPGDERWMPRQRLRGSGAAKVDYVLRRCGWFRLNGIRYLFIPDTLDEDWTKGRVRYLSPVETATLVKAFQDGRFWEEWETLVRAEE